MRVVICYALFIFNIVLLVRVLSSFFRVPPGGPIAAILGIVFALTEPVLRPIRSMLPPVRMGVVGLDLSPIIVFVVLGVLSTAICRPA